MPEKLPLRKDIPAELTWDLSLLFKNQDEFEMAVADLKHTITQFRESYQANMETLEQIKQAVLDYEVIQEKASHIVNYGNLPYTVDRSSSQNQENILLCRNLTEWMGQQLAFFIPFLAQLDSSQFAQLTAMLELAPFAAFFKNIQRQQAHLLSDSEEALLSALFMTLNGQESIYNTLKFEDLTFDDFEVNGQVYYNSFAGFEQDFESDFRPEVRHQAWKSFHEGLRRYQHTAAENYIQRVQYEKKLATLRGFDSVIDFLLYDQEIDKIDYHRIIDTLMAQMGPVMQRYARLLKEERGLDEISLADIKTAFLPASSAKISIPESREILNKALGVLGEDYLALVNRAFEERWIDFPMNEGKTTGGFCSPSYQKPSYILLNWTGYLSEVLVLAHELGHAAHFFFGAQHQPALTIEPSLYFIEAPSTCNEVITCQYLLNQPLEAETKRDLIAEFISRTYYHNMVTHLLEAAFQRKVYTAIDNGEVLNASKLNAFFKEVLAAFWGDGLMINPGAELTWMRQPHYFSGLYSYTYAAGLSIGTQVGQRISQGDQGAIDAWNAVIRMGGTLSPMALAQKAGVDMTQGEPITAAVDYVSQLLDQIESLKSPQS